MPLTCFSCFVHLQRRGGGVATERGLDQRCRQQGLLPPPPGCMEGRRTDRKTSHSQRTFTPQNQRAGLLLHLLLYTNVDKSVEIVVFHF